MSCCVCPLAYSIIHYMSRLVAALELTPGYDATGMPRQLRLRLPPVEQGSESIGRRLSRIRKEQGYTQVELAQRIGIIQALVSDYERGKLRLNAEMLIRFAQALNVSADEILGITAGARRPAGSPTLRITRRLNRIASLAPKEQKIMLKAIDSWLEASRGKTGR